MSRAAKNGGENLRAAREKTRRFPVFCGSLVARGGTLDRVLELPLENETMVETIVLLQRETL